MKKHSVLIYFLLHFILLTTVPVTISLLITRPRPTLPDNLRTTLPKSQSDHVILRVLDAKTNTVFTTSLEEYLPGVLAAEMPASYELEALKAQAVAARSFIMSKLSETNTQHPDATVCTDSTHCKAWLSEDDYMSKWKEEERPVFQNKIYNAVKSTKGEYMVYGEKIVEAFFFAGSGGRTESAVDIWGGDRPYLQSVSSEGDIYSPHFKSELTVPINEFLSVLNISNSDVSPQITSRTQGGSVRTLTVGGQTFSGSEIRALFGLKSSNFTISREGNNIVFHVLGYGHGVGMSQFGANYMAKNGKNYTEILKHYYTNIQIIKN